MIDTNIITSKLYNIVELALSKKSRSFLRNIADFINKRHKELFDIAPYDRIYFNRQDVDNLYRSIGLTEATVTNIMKEVFYWNRPYNPSAAKEPYIMVLLCAIRYFLKTNDRKNAELTTIYLAFSGKIYASLHALFWKKYPPRNSQQVMDYVVNNMLSDKFDLKKEGSVFKAIQKLCITWLNTYEKDIIKEPSDDEWGKLLQQLRDRVKSFLRNISELFFQAYEEKLYLNYESDDLDPDAFRLTDNDAARALRITEATMGILTSQRVNMEVCNSSKNENVSANEIKDIIETILGDSENLPSVRKVVNIIICDFMQNYPNGIVGSINFIAYSLKAKPNTKSQMLLYLKKTITEWLDESSAAYRKRKSRIATANNYYRSILGYFTIMISKAAMNL